MFFKEIHLKRNHWSFKLLQYTFPNLDRFNNFCPHFWLTILSIVIFPIVTLVKGGIWFFRKLGEILMIIPDFIDDWMEAKDFSYLEKLPEEQVKVAVYAAANRGTFEKLPECEQKRLKKIYKLYYKHIDQLSYKIEINDRYWESYDDIKPFTKDELEARKYFRELAKRQEEIRLRKLQNAKDLEAIKNSTIPKLMFIAKYIAAPIGIIIGIAVACIAIYYFALLLGWLWYWIVYFFSNYYVDFFIGVGIVLAVAAGIVLLIFIAVTIGSAITKNVNLDACIPKREFFYKLTFPFRILWRGISSTFAFIWLGIKSFKQDNCPGIVWEDKD